MEIVNNQAGRDFASPSLLSSTNTAEANRVDKALQTESTSDSSRLANAKPESTPNKQSDPSLGEKQANETQSEKTLAQVEAESADNNKEAVDSVALETAVQEVESFIQTQNRALEFAIDENTQRSVVTVKDSQSGDVIRQIPSEEVLKLAERIQDLQQDVGTSVGVFINNQV